MSSRRHVVSVLLPQPGPEPTYPEYDDVRAEARRRSYGPIGQQSIDLMREVIQRRGGDWCTAVLGRPFLGLNQTPGDDSWMLVVADERGLEPELPASIVTARKEAEERRIGREREAAALLEMAKRAWVQLAVTAPVPLTVHENTRHHGPKGHLRHVVADVDLVSGRSRKHVKGAGLCETEQRPQPLQLGEAVDLPPTCWSCKNYVPLVRTLDAPAPPTAAERKLLELVSSGVVFTLRPGRGQPTIRDTSQRSHGTAWGQLGRKVDASVRKLEEKGWVAKDAEFSATQTGHYGDLWRLTDTGSAALEN